MTTKCVLSITTFLFAIAFCEGYPYYPLYEYLSEPGNPETKVVIVDPLTEARQMMQVVPTDGQGFSRVNRGPFGLNQGG